MCVPAYSRKCFCARKIISMNSVHGFVGFEGLWIECDPIRADECLTHTYNTARPCANIRGLSLRYQVIPNPDSTLSWKRSHNGTYGRRRQIHGGPTALLRPDARVPPDGQTAAGRAARRGGTRRCDANLRCHQRVVGQPAVRECGRDAKKITAVWRQQRRLIKP